MAYIGFDLDATLGDFTPLQEFDTPALAKDGSFNPEFVRYAKLLAQENVGIFNKTALDYLRLYKTQKLKGGVKAIVIYSNNSNEDLLLLVAHAINIRLYTDDWKLSSINQRLIDLVAGRNAPGRPRTENPPKTLDYLKYLFQLITKEDTIPTEQIQFHDDIDHPDLQRSLGPNYHKMVPPYENPTPIAKIQAYFTGTPKENAPNPPIALSGKYNVFFENNGKRGGTRRRRKQKKTRKQKKSIPKRR